MQAEPIGPVHVDKDILRQCCAFGFDERALVADLKGRKTTRATVTYYLALTQRVQFNKGDYLQGQLCESSQAQLQPPAGIMLSPGDEQPGCPPPPGIDLASVVLPTQYAHAMASSC